MTTNVNKLIIRKMSVDAVPKGGGFQDAIGFLMNPTVMHETAVRAIEWVGAAIQAVKDAPDNPYGDDDEVIAGIILEEIEKRDKHANLN
ncbi:MAG: hypothetical protein WC057_08505 [Dehalococcoidales bacterium]|jgi:hypothetical protein